MSEETAARIESVMVNGLMILTIVLAAFACFSCGVEAGRKSVATIEKPCVEPPNPPHQGGVVMTFCP